jgi:alpha-galactosidase
MQYLQGLYAFWDELIARWPNSFRIGCASGGKRIDLESIRRFHTNQKSDYWFDSEVDQASMQGLGRWLPNVSFMAPVNKLDDYSFHSAMLGSLNLGWIADAADFDIDRARKLVDRYRAVRHLLIGDFYALTEYNRSADAWCALQFHRADLNEGMLILFRRPDAGAKTFTANLQRVDTGIEYELKWLVSDNAQRVAGQALARGLSVTVPEAPGTELVTYRCCTSL